MGVITLTTDFGTRDYYVGTMKGVILRIDPDAQIVDVTHEIEKQDITEAAIILRSARGYFPDGTVHVAVVDPGVGGSRRPVVVESAGQFFVGPDNGIFSVVLEPDHRAWELTETRYRLDLVSDTFHGRDIFAPAAAHLGLGLSPRSLGPPVEQLVRLTPRQPISFSNRILGEVVHVDSFGNLITNVSMARLEETVGSQSVMIRISGRTVRGISRTYTDVDPGELVAVIGSTDLLEIAVRDGNAHRKLGVGRGDPLELEIGG